MSQRCIDVECFAGNLELLAWKHGAQGSHVVQTVGHLDKNHTDVVGHGEQQFAEILGLSRSAVAEYAARNLCEAFHQRCNLASELRFDVLHGVVGVLYHIVQQSGAYRSGAEPYFLAYNLCDGQRVHYVRFARATAYPLMCALGKLKSALYYVDLLSVIAVQIPLEQTVELLLHHSFLVSLTRRS